MSTASHAYRGLGLCLVVAVAMFSIAAAALAQDQADDGPRYPVSQILLDFSSGLPIHPPAQQLMRLEVRLGDTGEAFVAPRPGVEQTTIKLVDVPQLNKPFHASALNTIGLRIARHFAEWGYSGIRVKAHRDDINAKGSDIRPAGQTALRMVIGTDGTWQGVPGRPDETVTATPFKITQFLVAFDRNVPRRPPISEVMQYQLDLGEVTEGYVGPRPGGKLIRIRLGDISSLPKSFFFPSAIKTVCERLEDHLAKRGFTDLQVIPHPDEINEDGQNTRYRNQTALRLIVRPAPPKPEPLPQPEKPAIVQAPEPEPLYEVDESDGKLYPVSQIIVEYAEPHPDQPPLDSLMAEVQLRLVEAEEGYVGPVEGMPLKQVALTDLPLLPKQKLYGSAIRHISRQIVAHLVSQGYIGINVSPHPEEIDNQAEDIRPLGQTALRLLVRIGRVTEIRTIAAGDRIPLEQRINNPDHERLAEDSPVQPGIAGTEQGTDLLRKEALDRYVGWLSRHPGRRVDVAVSPAQQPGSVALDLLVTEAKPWMVYAQFSNTGTETTDEWRERFGFVHHQLTGNDDTLSIDYITANFDQANTVIGSYEAPFFDVERLRWRVQATWSEFSASEVGFAAEEFTGDAWSVGGDLIWNFFQKDELFIDLVAGVKFQNIHVNNQIIGIEGETNFFLPHIGLRAERYTETANTYAMVDVDINLSSVAGTDQTELNNLGRIPAPEPEKDFLRVTWDVTHAFYLEPLLWHQAWLDASTPDTSTLAHELAFSFKGQYSPDRMVPQFERTAGGLYSVRGYDESLTAGDTAILASAEYRFHLPRIFTPQPEPGDLFGQPFRWAPQTVYGRPDWDLILRGFIDYGKVINTDRHTTETDFDLLSTGVGAELLVKRNFNIRVDWGYVLEELENRVDSGESRVHIVATILY